MRRVAGRRARRVGLLAALAIGAVGATQRAEQAAAASNCSTSGATVTCTYTGTGEQTLTAPDGVTSLRIMAIGGAGGSNGGHGAKITTTLAVNPGDTLYVEVGGNGGGAGGFGGGGAGADGSGGGGGATDVQTVHCTVASSCVKNTPKANVRVVAGGGGGGSGGSDGGNAGNSDGSGSAGSPDPFYPDCAYPGLPCAGQGGGATMTAGGAGGGGEPADSGAFPAGGNGASGTFGVGGAGGNLPSDNSGSGGGGGGGGLYGGGGGGGAHYAAGAGGGGSSYSAGTNTSFSADTTGSPQVVIQYTPATLTITANDKSMTYGGAVPALTASYSGFVNGDTAASLTTAPTCTTTATSHSPAGHYAITCSGAVDPNYSISYVAGTLTVNPAALTITADDKSMTYGGAPPALTASYSGLVNGDTPATFSASPNTAPTLSTVTAGSHAGSYAITVGGAVDPNYSISYVAGTLTIAKASLTITANDKSMTYGHPVPAFDASYSGLVNGDSASSLTTAPTCGAAATSSSPVGTYAITCSGAVDPDYTIGYQPGTLTVNPASLTITANDKSTTYGGAVPSFDASYSGLVNGDSSGVVSGLICGATNGGSPVSSGTPAGSYTITCAGGAATNYSITYQPGTLTIGPAPLTITADNQSKVYGQPNPTFTVTPSGLVNGDTLASLQGTLSVATAATQFSAPGTYALTPGGLSSPNYSITYGAGTLTIAKDASTSTLSSSANPAPFGQPVVLTANVGAASPGSGTPTGTVTFLDGGTPLGTATLKDGQASLTTATLLGGAHNLSVSYGGDADFTAGASAPLAQAVTFSRTVGGTASGLLTVHAGEAVLINGTVNGPLTVQAGGAVALVGARVSGPLTASGAAAVALCGSTIGGSVSISGATGFVRLGAGSDDPGVSCAGDTLQGPLSLNGNKGGVEVEGATIAGPLSLTNTSGGAPGEDSAAPELEGNTIGGPLSCSGNTPPPTSDGRPNTASGPKSGQCAGL